MFVFNYLKVISKLWFRYYRILSSATRSNKKIRLPRTKKTNDLGKNKKMERQTNFFRLFLFWNNKKRTTNIFYIIKNEGHIYVASFSRIIYITKILQLSKKIRKFETVISKTFAQFSTWKYPKNRDSKWIYIFKG